MASRALRRRADQLLARVPHGCPACRGCPPVWLIGGGAPEPPAACGSCGRWSTAPYRIYVGHSVVQRLRRCAFAFVRSTICYALLKRAGFVDDHVAGCRRAA